MNRNYPVSAAGSVGRSVTGKTASKTGKEPQIGIGIKTTLLAAVVLATAGVAFYFGTTAEAVKANRTGSAERRTAKQIFSADNAHSSNSLPNSLSLPLFFEPNQGQSASQVKFLAHGSGYGLFLTADEAVLQIQSMRPDPRTATANPKPAPPSVIRMKLDRANSAGSISGAEPLPGKSNYFIGSDPAKWRRNIPQFARVEYKGVYPGVDLVYYGEQGHLEYDFRVAPAADPNQIVLNFQGATAHIASGDAGDSGDLILDTANGVVRFHAPRVYQPATPRSGNLTGNPEKVVAGGFRQLAANKIGFTIGDYDHSRELVIDPVLSYSTYLGGSGTEGGLVTDTPRNVVKVAIDSGDLIYLAGSTNSPYFLATVPANPSNPPIQDMLTGSQNIFIAVLNTNPNLPFKEQLVYATYLGGSQVDSLAGIAVDQNRSIYVAGTTTSPDFPTTSSALPQPGAVSGTHGYLSAITLVNNVETLGYSTYLAGNGSDSVTGLAVDQNQNAYVTGVTTSSNPATQQFPFPANPNGYQTLSNSPGNPQFFASKINTTFTGSASMIYSTYFGGGNPATAIAIGGGIAVDPSGSNISMYFTGTTNMLPTGVNGGVGFPLVDAQDACLNTNCNAQTTATDAFAAKINPNQSSLSSLIYSTYLGGSSNDNGIAVDVDTSSNAYITGSTASSDWVIPAGGFQTNPGGGIDAFIAKIGGSISGSIYPLNYFTYLGGIGDDIGEDIKVDTVGAAHVVGLTNSTNFPTTVNTVQPCLGDPGVQPPCTGDTSTATDAFAASISTSLSATNSGDFSTYLGGSGLDQGTGVAVDNVFGATYVAGITQSTNFPIPAPPATLPYQAQLNGAQDAFVSRIGASSTLVLSVPSNSPSPFPTVAAGMQVAFTFDITNMNPIGTDPASNVVFSALGIPTTGLANTATAKITSNSGTCGAVQGSTISCTIPNLAVNQMASVEVDLTPAVPIVLPGSEITVSGNASANGGPVGAVVEQPIVDVVDFTVNASPSRQTINNGDFANIQVFFCPTSNLGYSATITPTQTTSPSMVTANTPTFNPTTVTIPGSGCGTTTLTIATVARPVTTGNVVRRYAFYAAWLPIGGLSLIGLGISAGRRRRRWMLGAVLVLIAGIILLQPACGSASSTNTTTGGTLAGTYDITIFGAPSGVASHSTIVQLQVN